MLHKTRLLVVTAVLGSFFATVPLRAVDRDDRRCEERIHKAQEQLERAERRHGEHSRQAEEKRHHLEEVRERCHGGDHDHDRH